MPTWSCTLRHAISGGMSIKRSQLRAKVNDVRPPLAGHYRAPRRRKGVLTKMKFMTVLGRLSSPFTCQIVVKFTTANPGRKQEIVHEYHYNPLSASFI